MYFNDALKLESLLIDSRGYPLPAFMFRVF
jgi:hypothetical protein